MRRETAFAILLAASMPLTSGAKCAGGSGGAASFVVSRASLVVSRPMMRAAQQSQNQTMQVDGIAARIEGDIITESEIDELAAFQRLVEGKAGDRNDIILELSDQWIVENEAQNAHFSKPSADDVNEALTSLAKQVGPDASFEQKIAQAGLTPTAVRRELELQIYLNRYLDYKFRAVSQVSEKQIQDYYQGEFARQVRAKGQALPPLEDVHAEIHRLLTERIITDRATKWLDDTRSRLRLEILPKAGGS